MIHTAQSLERGTRTLLDGSKATSRKKDTPVFENGCSMDEDYSRDDPRMQSIPDRYFYLDMAKLKRDAKAGVPVPGVTLIEGTATIARR